MLSIFFFSRIYFNDLRYLDASLSGINVKICVFFHRLRLSAGGGGWASQQMRISRQERRKDPRLSTMQRTVAAMGGQLLPFRIRSRWCWSRGGYGQGDRGGKDEDADGGRLSFQAFHPSAIRSRKDGAPGIAAARKEWAASPETGRSPVRRRNHGTIQPVETSGTLDPVGISVWSSRSDHGDSA